jgi:preprotein translocase subunit SecF
LHGFSFALVVGIIVGSYSTIFVASPLVLMWNDWREGRRPAVAAGPAAKPAATATRKGQTKVVK